MLGKVSNIDGVWKRIELSKEEYDTVMDQLLETNMREVGRIVEKIGNSDSFSEKERMDVVAMLAEKQLMASFTAVNNALENKIHLIKSGRYEEVMEKPPKPPESREEPKPKEEGKPEVVKEAEEELETDKHKEEVLEEEVTTPKNIVQEAMDERESRKDFSPKTDSSSFSSISEDEAKKIKERNEPPKEEEKKNGMFSKFRRNNGE